MRQPSLIITVLTGACSLWSCTGLGGDASTAAVPRPTAWVRIEMPDSSYTPFNAGPLRLLANSGASVHVRPAPGGEPGTQWIDLAYPTPWSPRVSLTLTPATGAKLEATLANRRQRMALDLGATDGTQRQWRNPRGWLCTLVTARSLPTTPLMLLATDGSAVLSGTLTLSQQSAPAGTPSPHPDPLAYAPVIDAVERDLIVLLDNLGQP